MEGSCMEITFQSLLKFFLNSESEVRGEDCCMLDTLYAQIHSLCKLHMHSIHAVYVNSSVFL